MGGFCSARARGTISGMKRRANPEGLVRKRNGWRIALLIAVLWAVGGAASAQGPVYLAFFGDSGTGDSRQRQVAAQLDRVAAAGKLNSVFLLGDNIYSKGQAKYIRPKFLDVYQPLFARNVTFHAALGNHDAKTCDVALTDPLPRDAGAYEDCDVGVQLAEPRFGYPEGRRYYSMTGPGAPPLFEVFVIDTNTLATRYYLDEGLPPDRAQLEWLARALEASKATWKIVTMHNAMHTPAPKTFLGLEGHKPERGLQLQLDELFREKKVHAVFQGHNHFYARLLPLDGVRYFVAGGGGRRPYGFKPKPGYVVPNTGSGKFNHFVHVRLSESSFDFCTVDSEGVIRDSGGFRRNGAAAPGDGSGCPF